MWQTQTGNSLTDRWLLRLGAPVDIASLVFFRICFGLVLHWEIWRFFTRQRIEAIYIAPAFHFKYLGFGWVDPLPGNGMYVVFGLLGILALGIAFGLFYRVSCVLFGIGFLYIFLIEETEYLNHYYLVILLSFLMAAIPAHGAMSIDAWRKSDLRAQTVPTWGLWLLRVQIGIVYSYAGLAKLKWDWLHGRPTLDMWSFAALEHEWMRALDPALMALFLSYGGLLLDLFVVPLLLWRKTRAYAFAATLFFHASNKLLFAIGIFPYLMTAATTLFFEPDWPRRLWGRIRPGIARAGQPAEAAESKRIRAAERAGAWKPLGRGWAWVLAVYLIIQLTIPLRHYAYPGSVTWTEEGQYFAWHMLLRAKNSRALFRIVDRESGAEQEVSPVRFLPKPQLKTFGARPDMILQFAHYLQKELEALGYRNFAIYVDALVTLNGRKPELIIDPQLDLTQVKRGLKPKPYIMPLTEPLPSTIEYARQIKEQMRPETLE